MAVLQITIPDELKTQFEQAFSGHDVDTVVSHLMSDRSGPGCAKWARRGLQPMCANLRDFSSRNGATTQR